MHAATRLRLSFFAAALALAAIALVPAAALAGPSVASAPASSAASASAPALQSFPGIPFRLRVGDVGVRDMALGGRPFSSSQVTPRDDPGIHDAFGVRMRRVKGQLYDFPRGQASYGLENLNSWRVTGDTFFYDRALAQAERLVSYHDDGGGAWYYPNYPSKARHGRPAEWIQAPYYSALPEGRILLLFARLAEVTGEAKWRDAADHTFAAFLRPGPCSGPFVLDIDRAGYYWLQEWPWPNGLAPDCTLNGHNSSLFGLYEYYEVTRDERARELFRAAVTTVQHYLPTFRRPGWISCYCLAHRSTNANYHNMHIGQLLELFRMTGDAVFARYADSFNADYPHPGVEGTVHVQPGSFEAMRVSRSGAVLARRTLTARRAFTCGATRRQRLYQGSPVMLRVNGGAWDGWWIPERAGKAWVQGVVAQVGYEPVRTLTVGAGVSRAALQFDDEGTVTATAQLQGGAGLRLSVDRSAIIDGVWRARIDDGDLAGYWVELGRGVRLF